MKSEPNALNLVMHGIAEMKLNRPEEAAITFSAVLELEPDNTMALALLEKLAAVEDAG